MSTDSIPGRLRQALDDDHAAVRPLHPVWMRVVVASAITAAVLAFVLANASLRTDIDLLPMWLSWGCSALQAVFGLTLVGLALREGVPGAGAPAGAVRLAAATALALQIAVGVATSIYSPAIPIPGNAISPGVGCLKHEAMMALPTFVLTLWLLLRALPLRAPTAGLVGGAGATVAADAAIHLLCPMANLSHVLVWHTGAVLLFMAAGWLLGHAWDRIRFGFGA